MLDPLFLDTAYLVALLHLGDQWHPAAVYWHNEIIQNRTPILTTEYILVEFADGLSVLRFRKQAEETISVLRSSPYVEVVPASTELFDVGLALFRDRLDKDWSLTDWISIVVMQNNGLLEALTSDHHFEQAGFRALLREKI